MLFERFQCLIQVVGVLKSAKLTSVGFFQGNGLFFFILEKGSRYAQRKTKGI